MYSRRVPSPKLATPWRCWGDAVLDSLEAHGSWTGSYEEALAAAQSKLQGRSMNEHKQSTLQGWDTPEGLLARWTRVRHLDGEAVGDMLTVKARTKKVSKGCKRPLPSMQPSLFDDEG